MGSRPVRHLAHQLARFPLGRVTAPFEYCSVAESTLPPLPIACSLQQTSRSRVYNLKSHHLRAATADEMRGWGRGEIVASKVLGVSDEGGVKAQEVFVERLVGEGRQVEGMVELSVVLLRSSWRRG